MAGFDAEYEMDEAGTALELKRGSEVLYGDVFAPKSDQFLWPPTLAIEIALRTAPVRDICEAYEIDKDQWHAIRSNPVFVAELTAAVESMRRDGAAFKARAQMMSLELLKENWRMIMDKSVPVNIRADLMKNTFRIAGLDASKEAGAFGGGKAGGTNLLININLG